MTVLELAEIGQGLLSWIRIDASGNSQVIEIDKLTILDRTNISARDFRILDPLFIFPTTILGREKAIVANLEKIRCIITTDEVLLLNSHDKNVLQYVMQLQKRLRSNDLAEVNSRSSSNGSFKSIYSYNPFEFTALAVALDVISGSLDYEALELKTEAYLFLDELTKQVSNLKLEQVRGLKSRLIALTRRTYKIREEIQKTMDEDKDMAEMYLTKKKKMMMDSSTLTDYDREHQTSSLFEMSRSTPHEGPFRASNPIFAPPNAIQNHLRNVKANVKFENTAKSVEELESLLEAYFVAIDSILNKLITLKEYIDDTENFINIKLNIHRNRLIQFELLMTSATFVLAIFGIVIGIFGINFPVPLFDNAHTIKLVLIITSVFAFFIYFGIVCFFKWWVFVM